MKCKDISFGRCVQIDMVEQRTNQDFGACELKSLFVFSICFGWSIYRHQLLLFLLLVFPQRLSSDPAAQN